MRFSALALALFLTACGDDDAPAVVDATDVTVTTVADPVVVEDGAAPADARPDASTASVAAPPAPDEVDPADAALGPEGEVFVGMWAGDAPVTAAGTHFVAVPPVRAKLEEAFGVEPGLLAKLSNLDDEPYFLITPIEAIGSTLGMTFVSNAKFNEDPRTLHLLVANDASHVFALLTGDNGDTFYRASYDASAANLPADAAAWMSRKGGVDFAQMVRTNDETEISP